MNKQQADSVNIRRNIIKYKYQKYSAKLVNTVQSTDIIFPKASEIKI